MKTGNRPAEPKSSLGSIQPIPMDAEAIKRAAWHNEGILVVSIHDDRLTWPEIEIIKQIGGRLWDEKC